MTEKEREKLAKKAYHPSKLTAKELAQLRRSNKVGSKLLSKVVKEQLKRKLLRTDYKGAGWPPEIKKRIKDYD